MSATQSLSLYVTHPGGFEAEYLIAGELKVGRQAECDVRVASAYLSRLHFVVRPEGGGVVVETPHERTAFRAGFSPEPRVLGAYVNGQRVIGVRPLAAGDRITVSEAPGPDQPVFVIGPTRSPTSADQLPAQGASGGMGKLIAAGCLILGILAAVGAVLALASS